jgi:hypothetical protein
MSTNTTEAESKPGLVCSDCHCDIECCAFCEEEECGAAICFGCMVVDLGQTRAQPHDHGG